MAYKGPDISSWQGDINIKALAPQVDFFIFRCYAGSSKDSKVDRNVKLAIENKKPYGLYIYSYALNTAQAKEEAKRVVTLANSYSVKPNFLVIDMEDADGYKKKYGMPSNSTLKAICTEECEIFENAGYYAMVYASSSWFKNQLAGLTAYDKWVAHWPTSGGKQKGNAVDPSGENANNCGIWQFTSQGSLNGYSGRLDMNYGYKDFIVKGFDAKQETKKSVDEIAREVINGQWGNGDERKKKLEAAGYDYNAVQNRVNEILEPAAPKKSVDEIAKEVIEGKWGNGSERKSNLEAAGYNYDEVQNKVNEMLNKNKTEIYTVVSGDSLSKIGAKYGVKWQAIASENGIRFPYVIYPGQKLKIPR